MMQDGKEPEGLKILETLLAAASGAVEAIYCKCGALIATYALRNPHVINISLLCWKCGAMEHCEIE